MIIRFKVTPLFWVMFAVALFLAWRFSLAVVKQPSCTAPRTVLSKGVTTDGEEKQGPICWTPER